MLLAAREGVELFQGHGFEIEPICLLWQSIFIDVYTIGTLNFEMKIRCIICLGGTAPSLYPINHYNGTLLVGRFAC